MLMNPPMHASEQNVTADAYSNAQRFDVTTVVDQHIIGILAHMHPFVKHIHAPSPLPHQV